MLNIQLLLTQGCDFMKKTVFSSLTILAVLLFSSIASAREAIYVFCKIDGQVAWYEETYSEKSANRYYWDCHFQGGIPDVHYEGGNPDHL